ncbi:hypothetical protein RFI_18903 [Reticulomyxa filosa]|uniref:Deubiquitinating enzyme MINDY-3/4 conserved domain-containing protein n=1 Tax=Reticulomyxa filosa TaxID=46433 RepID=X6MX51_RETFI|nr:hypothetical protein RFI_18903 [Reticulomyxa filosa]|eukprot:ETO18369.1 hypothetical protein RFI_18903 [Reticulomyxa filosa]
MSHEGFVSNIDHLSEYYSERRSSNASDMSVDKPLRIPDGVECLCNSGKEGGKKKDKNMNRDGDKGSTTDTDNNEMYSIFPPFVYDSKVIESEKKAKEVDQKTIERVKDLIWGKDAEPKDVNRWYQQGFEFVSDENMRFGLLQLHGGPCGILASVQGYILRELVFDTSLQVQLRNESEAPIVATDKQKMEALLRSLQRILVQCARDKCYLPWVVALDSHASHVWCTVCTTSEDLKTQIVSSLPLLSSSCGVVAFLFSVVMARSVDRILEEVDDSTQSLVLPQF